MVGAMQEREGRGRKYIGCACLQETLCPADLTQDGLEHVVVAVAVAIAVAIIAVVVVVVVVMIVVVVWLPTNR